MFFNLGILASSGSWRKYDYITTTADATNLTTYTFSSQSFGTAATSRIVAVVVSGERGSGTPSSITSVTIGGIAATSRISRTSDAYICAIYTAAVPTGTTGDIVVTFGQAQDSCVVSIFSMYGLSDSGVPIAGGTGSTTTDNGNIAITTIKGAIVLAGAITSGSTTYTWTGVTELYDAVTDTRTRSTAAIYATGTTTTVAADAAAGNFFVTVAAAFK